MRFTVAIALAAGGLVPCAAAEGADPNALALLRASPIVFVVRPQYKPDHHNTATMFQTGEINTGSFQGGGAIKVLDAGTGTVRTLLAVPEGIARDIEVSFDGTRILFSMRRDRDDDYHIYEMDAGGGGLRQLSFGAGVSDIDPLYLADGRIVFTSTREPKYCMCNRHIMGNLFTMDAGGANMQQIGHSTLHEGHAALSLDGRIMYDRWEYVDRNFGDAQGVWTVSPDGTNHALLWGNNTNSPGAVLDARAVPGAARFIATFSSCHDRPWGALALVDPQLGLDGRAPVVRTWPAGAIELVGVGNYDTFTRVPVKYEDPYPLDAEHFLCARMTGRGEEMGIYLVDCAGRETLVHAEAPGCFDPMPLAPRPRPPVIAPRTNLAASEGRFYAVDVYLGSGMERVEPGSVKFLRIVESPEKRFWTQPAWDGGTGQQAPGMAWDDFNNKRIVGTVPVEADGSVYFTVPADTYVYFQLLDANGMMIQTMRSGTIARPGETTGCVGCHEDRRTAAPQGGPRAALRGGPRSPAPWYGPARLFSFAAEVQPVFDAHCVACHDYGLKAGAKLNLAGDHGVVFNTSYVELRARKYVDAVGAGPFQVLPPKTWGSHRSRLVKVLREGHGVPEIDARAALDKEGFDRIVTWIDINAPYYPDYAGGAYRDRPFGRSPLDTGQLARLRELTGIDAAKPGGMTEVSFTRPETSPALARIADATSPVYAEALAIIRAGAAMLAAHPRADMPGCALGDPRELAQERKYAAQLEVEARMRAAIARGGKEHPRAGTGAGDEAAR